MTQLSKNDKVPQCDKTAVDGSFKSRFFNKPQELDIEFIERSVKPIHRFSVNGM